MRERAKALAGMLVLGAVLAGVRAGLTPDPEPVAGLDDQTLLVEQALEAGWHRTDPVVRTRLVDNLRFAGREGPEDALFAEALELGMARTDPVVRQHLAARARRALEAVREPTTEELQAWLDAHPEDFAREPVLTVVQEPVDGPVAGLPSRLAGTPSQLGRRLGGDLSGLAASIGATADIASAWGVLQVEVTDVSPGGVPELSAIRAEVRQAWIEAERAKVVPERLATLRREALR